MTNTTPMHTTTTDRPTAAEVAALLREIPTRDTPDDVIEAWIARRDAILAEIAAGAR